VQLVDILIDACREAGVRRLLHMSALNADESKGSSEYLRSKGQGENRAHTRGQASIHVSSFRPSVIFGPGDSFFNRFAGLLRLSPGIFPLACPDSRFAPVYVGDVAEAFARALDDPTAFAQRYDLCGPRVFSLRELVAYTAGRLELRTRIVGLGDRLSRMQARLLGLLPGKPFTLDNYLSLQTDSVCKKNGLAALGITPTDIEAAVPLYLGQRSQRQRYFSLRKPA
jgi:NADH dehydrogenase